MDTKKDALGMLELLVCPGFCVKENQIVQVNRAAQGMLLTEGTDVRTLLLTGQEEYAAFDGGCLCLSMALGGETVDVSILRIGDQDLFLLETSDEPELKAMSLTAKELRLPLTLAMPAASRLQHSEDPQIRKEAAKVTQGLFQILRIVNNMSDTCYWCSIACPEVRNMTAILEELFQKVQPLAESAGIQLTYQGISEQILCLVDAERLERGILNLISNALKFTPKGGTIDVSLVRRGQMLILSIQDSGIGIAEDILKSLYHRYLRGPCMEDSRFGLGLGILYARNAATVHGGTLLIDRPGTTGTRITMTLAIRQDVEAMLSGPKGLTAPYASGFDTALLELSNCLPYDAYME